MDRTDEIIRNAMRETRNDTLTTAAEICDDLAKLGLDAASCAIAIRALQARLTPPTTKAH